MKLIALCCQLTARVRTERCSGWRAVHSATSKLSFLTVHFEGKQRDFVPAQCRRFRARTESFPGWVKSAPVQRTGEHTEVPALVFYPIRWSITPHWGKFNLEQSSDGKSQEQLCSAQEPKAALAIARSCTHANSYSLNLDAFKYS